MPLLVEPAFGQEAADEAVDRALRRVQGADQLGERHARAVDDFFQNARDSIDRAVVLRHALRLQRGSIERCLVGFAAP